MNQNEINHTELIDGYIAIWNETDAAARRQQIEQIWTKNATYLDPMMQSAGHEGLDAMTAGVQQQFPNFHFRRLGEVNVLQNYLRFSWELVNADDQLFVSGTDFGVVSPDGRLENVVGFLDVVPAQA